VSREPEEDRVHPSGGRAGCRACGRVACGCAGWIRVGGLGWGPFLVASGRRVGEWEGTAEEDEEVVAVGVGRCSTDGLVRTHPIR